MPDQPQKLAIKEDASPWQKHFALMLHQQRVAADLSVRQLARKAGVYWIELLRYERAEQLPNIEHIYVLADILDLTLHDMLPASNVAK